MIEPVGYLDMVRLETGARLVMTDSGGIQKEAYWLRVPCVTLRTETEWVETVAQGWNTLAGSDVDRIVAAAVSPVRPEVHEDVYQGKGSVARLLRLLFANLNSLNAAAS
jgi:UDP-N-acetylglucosamine 2-epimerase